MAFNTNFLFAFTLLPYVHTYVSELKAKLTEVAYANSIRLQFFPKFHF